MNQHTAPASRIAIFAHGSYTYSSLRAIGAQMENAQAFFTLLRNRMHAHWSSSFTDPKAAIAQLVRIHWFGLVSMDDIEQPDSLREDYFRAPDVNSHFKAKAAGVAKQTPQSEEALQELGWQLFVDEARQWLDSKRKSLDGIKRFHRNLQQTNFMDLHETGHWRLDFLRRQAVETGNDTALAVSMVAYAPHYDIALLITSDADAIPSLQHLRNQGKQVIAVEFLHDKSHNRSRHASNRLKAEVDMVIPVYTRDLIESGAARQI